MNKLDRINDRILHELSNDGRLSNAELANRVGLSPSACLRRVQDLEKNGLIAGYRAVLNKEQLGIGCVAYVMVGLSDHTKGAQCVFEAAMEIATQVVECHNITGSYEYLIRVETNDLNAYKNFHTEVLGTLAQVTSITTYVVMDSTKDQRS